MNSLKVSWSILSKWSSGNRDEAIKMIMGEETLQTWNMAEGSRIHKIISDNRLKLLPFLSDSAIYEDVDRENDKWVNYFRVRVFDWLEMSMIADVIDVENGLLIDWKTGNKKSTEHNKLQLYCYAYLLSILPSPIEIKEAVIASVYQTPEETIHVRDFSLYKITDEKLEYAENYIESNASEIYSAINNISD